MEGGDSIEGWKHDWVYCSSIVLKGAVDGLYYVCVCRVDFWCGSLVSSQLDVFAINRFIKYMSGVLVTCWGVVLEFLQCGWVVSRHGYINVLFCVVTI